MAVLADLIPKTTIPKKTQAIYKEKTKDLSEYRSLVNKLVNRYNMDISGNKETSQLVLNKEGELYRQLWNECDGIIPEADEYKQSCIGTETRYTMLAQLSGYPTATIGQLKKIADGLGFIITSPVYINFEKLYELYDKNDYYYSSKVTKAINNFQVVIQNAANVTGSMRYAILCPLSMYDPWLDITYENDRIPTYFGKGLEPIKTTLNMVIPTQRNLYKMIKTTQQDINEIKGNIVEMQKTMQDFHRRLSWVESMVDGLERENQELRFELRSTRHKITELEIQIACLLDPIFFACSSDVDFSNSKFDDAKAYIGACFGIDMPVEFFKERGLAVYNHSYVDGIKIPFEGVYCTC